MMPKRAMAKFLSGLGWRRSLWLSLKHRRIIWYAKANGCTFVSSLDGKVDYKILPNGRKISGKDLFVGEREIF